LSKSVYRVSSNGRLKARVWFGLAAALVLFVFIAGGWSFSSSAQGTDEREAAFNRKADRILRGIRHAVEEDRNARAKGNFRPEAAAVNRLSRIAKIKDDKNPRINVAVTLTDNSERALAAAGFRVQSRVGDVATLEVDVDRLPDLAAIDSVQKIFASVARRPLNDRARQSAGIDNSLGQRVVTQTGHGVVVGIIDTGIDFRHLDFTLPGSGGHQTRIKAMLDMTEYGAQSPDPGWNYSLPGQSGVIGRLYTEADINAALQLPKPSDQNSDSVKQRDKVGHGTHVAGTAAGNGLAAPTAGTYSGMAPEADLIIVKASRQNNGEDDFDTTDIINGLEFVRQKAAELGEPFVINLSLGGHIGPHDGTDPDERAIDNLINSGPGRSVVVAAGNEGDESIHARGTVPAGGSQTLDFNVNGTAYLVDLYQNKADRFSVTVTSPDGVVLGPVAYDANGLNNPSGQGSNQYLQIFNANDDKGDADPANDQPDIALLFKPAAPDGMWKITLQDADSTANQSYDAWATGDGVYFSTFMDNQSHLVASPGTARGAITVGAFVTRSASQTIGAPASFTSPGPTADGRQKPEVSASGYYLYSSRSTDVIDPAFGTIGTGPNAPTDSTHYTGLAGTSMSTPVTTGAVALFLESNAALTNAQIKDSIRNSATHDSFTGPDEWTARFGSGKLDIAAAIQLGGRPVYTISGHVTPTIGVTSLTLSGSQSGTTNVDNNGNYKFKRLLSGGTYTITPAVITGPYQYTFSPPSYTFANLSANQTADFTATLATRKISGRITSPDGNGVAGIGVSPNFGSGTGVFSDANGYYVLDNLPAGQSYDVLVSGTDYYFDPNHQYLGVITKDETVNFVARRLFHISGRVTSETGNGLAGIFVSSTGQFAPSANTDSEGNYRLNSVLEGRDYPISIFGSGFVFTPNSAVITHVSGDTVLNFVAHPAPTRFVLYGFIRDTSGLNLEGVRVDLTGSSTGAVLTTANGLYRFDNLPAGGTYTVTPSANGLSFTPSNRTVASLSADTGGDFLGARNPIDTPSFFVTQQYRDFLNREPDAAGLGYWTSQITECLQTGANCDPQGRRINVSAAFFLSIEFQETGYLVERIYKSAYGEADALSALDTYPSQHPIKAPIVRFNEFLGDSQQISKDVQVGVGNWTAQLEANKVAFTQEFVNRTRFTTAYPTTLTPAQFVDALFQKAVVVPTSAERDSIIAEFGGAGTSTDTFARARALRRVAENTVLKQQETSKAFVLMQYFGYLRRDPNGAPDTDHTGYDFWLTKLNAFNGNYVNAQMVEAFIVSGEYRNRFGN
jgi:subtilisin family serine protease